MSKKSKTDLLVRQRFQNPLPAPAFPPKLLSIKTDPIRYATYDFLVPLSMERATPMIVDTEGGMHLDPNVVPGYWESEQQGRSGRMAPDMSGTLPTLDDDDLALLVDPPGANQAAAGIMPSVSGANLDLIGSGRINAQNQSPAALDRRKSHAAFIKRTDSVVASQVSTAAKKEALATQLAAQSTSVPEITVEQQLEAITTTFASIDVPLASIRHPTKTHLEAVETFDIFPDERIWANQYNLFKFSEDPRAEKRVGSSSEPISSTSTNVALFRPLQTEQDEGAANRIAYFLPDDEESAAKYDEVRRVGADVDQDLRENTDEAVPASADGDESNNHGFRFIRDYDCMTREVQREFVLRLDEKHNTAYYVPLVGHALLRKRRARKGEAANDYSDMGLDYWGGILVSVAGKDAFPEDEIEGRKEEMQYMQPPSQSNGVEANGQVAAAA